MKTFTNDWVFWIGKSHFLSNLCRDTIDFTRDRLQDVVKPSCKDIWLHGLPFCMSHFCLNNMSKKYKIKLNLESLQFPYLFPFHLTGLKGHPFLAANSWAACDSSAPGCSRCSSSWPNSWNNKPNTRPRTSSFNTFETAFKQFVETIFNRFNRFWPFSLNRFLMATFCTWKHWLVSPLVSWPNVTVAVGNPWFVWWMGHVFRNPWILSETGCWLHF